MAVKKEEAKLEVIEGGKNAESVTLGWIWDEKKNCAIMATIAWNKNTREARVVDMETIGTDKREAISTFKIRLYNLKLV